jgi:hypothetical protein
VTLKWRTTNAEDVDIDNGIGDVDDDGSERVRIYDDTTFRLYARGDYSSDRCYLTVRINEDDGEVAGVTYTENRYQDGVVLASTPYTGFDTRTTVMITLYSAIVLWAAMVAYAVVLKRRNKTQEVEKEYSESN